MTVRAMIAPVTTAPVTTVLVTTAPAMTVLVTTGPARIASATVMIAPATTVRARIGRSPPKATSSRKPRARAAKAAAAAATATAIVTGSRAATAIRWP